MQRSAIRVFFAPSLGRKLGHTPPDVKRSSDLPYSVHVRALQTVTAKANH
jgi:hypothetical protein